MNLCFSSFVFGSYDKYIPYYIYSIKRNYPDAGIKIFVENPLSSRISQTLDYLTLRKSYDIEIIEYKIYDFNFKEYPFRGGGFKTVYRFLIEAEFFKEYKYVYIGDIDILFLKEKQSLLEFHKGQMEILEVPFSNKVRLDANGDLTNRLTGLHFIKTKEYFEKVNRLIDRIKIDKDFRYHYLQGIERDEQLLYKINKDAFNFDPKLVSKAERPWHGLHLGITRGNKDIDIPTILENSSLSLEEIKSQLREYLMDPMFKEIQKRVFVVELEAILKALEISYSFSWKLKGFKYRKTRQLRGYKNRLRYLFK